MLKRPHITVVNYYYILPCNNGGKLATRDFYKALSEWFDITIVFCRIGAYMLFIFKHQPSSEACPPCSAGEINEAG